jgi:hypothetical protein
MEAKAEYFSLHGSPAGRLGERAEGSRRSGQFLGGQDVGHRALVQDTPGPHQDALVRYHQRSLRVVGGEEDRFALRGQAP